MKRKFVKVMFFGALALSTVTYVGCKDYDAVYELNLSPNPNNSPNNISC